MVRKTQKAGDKGDMRETPGPEVSEGLQFPKPHREKMTPRKWEERRIEVWERECGLCQGCFRFVPLTEGHIHHIKSRGAGGSHSSDNLAWTCAMCHDAVHRGLIKLGGENG